MTSDYYQHKFLEELTEGQVPVTAILCNGYQMQGYITHFDDTVIVMVVGGRQQMVYKQVLSTLLPFCTLDSLDKD